MPIDARINMGLRPQTYDAFAAYDTGRAAAQTAQANQMAMQAAQAEAELNRNAMLEAQTLDPNDRAAQQRYALRYGAAATPRLTALSGVDTNFAGRGTEARAQGEFATKQQAASSDALSEAIGMIVQDPSDARIAAARAAFVATGGDGAAFDAYAAPVIATDYASGARRPMVVNMIGGSPEGDRLVTRFTEKFDRTNMGDRSIVDQTNPYAPGFTPPVEQRYGESPNRPQYMAGEDGIVYRVPSSGPAAPIPVAGGGNLTAPTSAADERRQERREERAAAAERAAADAVNKANVALDTVDLAMDSTNWATAGLAGTLDWVPGSPPKRLAGYLNTIRANVAFNELQQMRRNSPTGGALGNVSNADMRLLQSTLATLDQQASPEDLLRALATIKRVTEAVRDAYAQDVRDFGVAAMGGSAPAPTPAPAGGGGSPQRIWDRYGVPHVIRGGQWVPE